MSKQYEKVLWAEIKQLEQHYRRNLERINYIVEKNGDISSRIQLKLDKFKS